MHLKVFVIFSLMAVASCDVYDIEARGKKKKIGLFIFFADLVIKKLFILKLVYAFILWLVIHKAGYFLTWFVHYLKEKKHEIHYDHHPHFEHYDHHPHYDHHDYGSSHWGGYGPYDKQSHGGH